jgi:acetyl-CoA carboxylase carboxyl transferase subunit alpha
MRIADEIVKEPPGGAHSDWDGAAESLREALVRHLSELQKMSPDELMEDRQSKFEAMGEWEGKS